MNKPQLLIDDETSPPSLPTPLPFFYEAKRSNLKNKMRSYEADQIKLTPGLDPSNLSTSPISEPIFTDTGTELQFANAGDVQQHMFNVLLTKDGIF